MSFMTPFWWIRAFEVAVQARNFKKDPFTVSAAAGLSPALTEVELNAFLVLLRLTQEQLFGQNEQFVYDLTTLQMHSSDRSPFKAFLFQRILQLLHSLRIESCHVANQGGGGKLDSLPLFLLEPQERGVSGHWEARYKLAPLGAECILGFADPYADLVRLIKSEPRAHRFLGSFPPLALRPALWLDLQGIEQYLFLQMLKTSLWESASLHWRPVFGSSVEAFFDQLDLPQRKVKGENETRIESPFKARLRFLKKLSRKLLDHGLIKDLPEDDFFAFGLDGQQISLLWSGEEMQADSAALRAYEAKCCNQVFQHKLLPHLKELLRVFVGNGGMGMNAAQRLCEELSSYSGAFASDYIRIEGNLLLPIVGLFFEWKLRQGATHELTLPSVFRESEALKISDEIPLAEQLAKFVGIIKGSDEIRHDVQYLPMASIAAPVTLKQSHVIEFLASHTLAEGGTLPSTSGNVSAGPSPQAVKAESVLGNPSSAPLSNAKKGYADVEMKKQAVFELKRMREADPQRYSLLKETYLENLDRERKNIILEMQKRMHPHAFDDHLKHSLVKYMIAHPRFWQGVDGSRSLS